MSVRSSLETSQQPAPSVTAEQLSLVAEAIAQQETISFDYQNARGERAHRRVEPYRQVHHLLRWYLLAWDLDRNDWRVFRLDRMTDVLRTGSRYQPRPLPAESATDYLRQGFNRHRQTVSLVVEAPATDVMDALRHQDAAIQPVGPHRTNVTVAIDSWQWLVLNLAFLDADFHITQGDTFTTACQTFAHRLLAATAPNPTATT
ncbi:helix-turn-helix transcriptional regulator [Kribbella swartbergensis]